MEPGRHLDSRRPSSCCGDPVASRWSVTRFSVPTPDFPHADGSARSPDDDVTAPRARAQVVVAPMDFVRLCDYERGADVPPLPVGALGRTTMRVLLHVHLPRPLFLAAFQLTRHSPAGAPGSTGSTAVCVRVRVTVRIRPACHISRTVRYPPRRTHARSSSHL